MTLELIIKIFKLIIFFSLVRWQTHHMAVTNEMFRIMIDARIESFLMFLKFRKFHCLMFYWKHKKIFDAIQFFCHAVPHDSVILAEYFWYITSVTVTVLISKWINNPVSLVSMLLTLNYLSMPFTIFWEVFVDYFFPLPGLNWEERVLEAPDFFLEDTIDPPLSKEEEEALNKAFQNIKANNLETPEGKKLHDEKVAEEKAKEARSKFHTYNFLTAYLAFNLSMVIIAQVLHFSRRQGGGD